MKVHFFIIFSVILIASCRDPQEKRPGIENGFLDLSSWDFEEDGLVNLDGQWAFYWEKLLSPEDLNFTKSNNSKSYIRIPGTWEKYPNPNDSSGKKYEIDSYATYVVKIIGLDEKF